MPSHADLASSYLREQQACNDVQAMAVCAAPAVGCMLMALNAPGRPDMELSAVWLGLTVLMAMRSLTIYVPYKLRRKPFDKVFIYPKEELWQD